MLGNLAVALCLILRVLFIISGALGGSEILTELLHEKRTPSLEQPRFPMIDQEVEIPIKIKSQEDDFSGASSLLEWVFRRLRGYCSSAEFDRERFIKDSDKLEAQINEIEQLILNLVRIPRIRNQFEFTKLAFNEISALANILGETSTNSSYGILLQCAVHMNIRLLVLHDSFGSFGWGQSQIETDVYTHELSFTRSKLEVWQDMAVSFKHLSDSEKHVLDKLLKKASRMVQLLLSYL